MKSRFRYFSDEIEKTEEQISKMKKLPINGSIL
jgi:hypothetical protein